MILLWLLIALSGVAKLCWLLHCLVTRRLCFLLLLSWASVWTLPTFRLVRIRRSFGTVVEEITVDNVPYQLLLRWISKISQVSGLGRLRP